LHHDADDEYRRLGRKNHASPSAITPTHFARSGRMASASYGPVLPVVDMLASSAERPVRFQVPTHDTVAANVGQ
jgi:hypothetical protein